MTGAFAYGTTEEAAEPVPAQLSDRAPGGESISGMLLDQSRWVITRWRRPGEGAIAPQERSVASEITACFRATRGGQPIPFPRS